MAPSSKGDLNVPHGVPTMVQSTLAEVAELPQQLRVSPWCHFWTGVLTLGTWGQGSSHLLCWGALHPGNPKPGRIGPAEVAPTCATMGGDRGAEGSRKRSITFGVGPTSMVSEYGSDHVPHLPWECWSTAGTWWWLNGGNGPQGWHMGETAVVLGDCLQ